MDDLERCIPTIIERHLGGQTVERIHDRDEIVRRIFEVQLAGGGATEVAYKTVLIKFQTHPEWLDTTLHDQIVTRMLRERGLGAPEVLAADKSQQLAPYSFVIERKGGGVRLDRLLAQANEDERAGIFRTIGQYYCQMNAILGPRQGIWLDDPAQTFPITPNDFYLQNELISGSGAKLVEEGRLSRAAWEQVIALWQDALAELNAQPAVMVHGSPFRWSIYLEGSGEVWQVCRISSVGDIFWGDAAYQVAMLLYPPFSEVTDRERRVLVQGYGPLPNSRHIWLHLLLQRIMAANGAFMEPQTAENAAWKAGCLNDIEEIISSCQSGRSPV